MIRFPIRLSSFIQKIALLQRQRRIKRLVHESDLFDQRYYRGCYPDVKQAGIDPLAHFIEHGASEGRNPSPKFDTQFYFASNPDVSGSGMNPLLHYILFGKKEGRSPLPLPVSATKPDKGQQEQTENDIQNLQIDYTLKVIFPPALQSYPFIPPGPLSYLNTWFDEVYLINLKSRSDRLLTMFSKLEALNIRVRVIEAINGSEFPHLYEYQQYKQLPIGALHSPPWEKMSEKKAIASPGAWGLLKTFRMVLRDAQEKRYRRILVLEDDAVFIQGFESAFRNFTQKIGDRNWKILSLGVSQHQWEIPENLVFDDPEIREFTSDQPWYHPVTSKGSFAVGIDSSVFPMLLEGAEKFDRPVDRVLHSVYQQMTTGCFVPLPNLIIADTRDSDIDIIPASGRAGFADKQKWNPEIYHFSENSDLVSVIVSAYNAGRTIATTLKSIMAQTYKNLEIIVVDDCSDDDTGEIVREFAGVDSRVHYIRHRENLGTYAARNTAIRHSRGKYISNVDADEVLLSVKIAMQLIPLISGRAKFSIAHMIRSHCTAEQLAQGRDDKLLQLARTFGAPTGSDGFVQELPARISLATTMASRSLFEKYGLYWEERFSSDAEIIERFLFFERDIRITQDYSGVMHYLSLHPRIDRLFYLLDEILLISTERNERNLTKIYPPESPIRAEFRQRWRKRFDEGATHLYPVLTPLPPAQ